MNFSFQNVIAGDGIGISITGMFVVFFGLSFISGYIRLLPEVLNKIDQLFSPKPRVSPASAEKKANQEKNESDKPEDEDLLAAISLVVYMELQNRRTSGQKITIQRNDDSQASWFWAGKMRTLRAGR